MAKFLLVTFALLGAASVITGVVGAIVYYGGFIDVSADTPHHALVFDLIEEGRERAIARSTRDITPPTDLADPERVVRGAGNYQAMCVGCHRSPGTPDSELRQGLYPAPPDLTKDPIGGMTSGAKSVRRFWVIKHGIKASAMPAWSKGGMEDSAIWDLAAFLDRLPALSPEQYQSMVAASGGHSHSGMTEMGHDHPSSKGHVDRPGSKPHTH